MTILGSTKLGNTLKGQNDLVALTIEQAELNADDDAVIVDDELVERYIQCATHGLPYFSVSWFGLLTINAEDQIRINIHIPLFVGINSINPIYQIRL